MKKLRTAIFGTGFMGRVHTEGVRRLGNVEVIGIAGSSAEKAKKFVQKVQQTYRQLREKAASAITEPFRQKELGHAR